MKAMEDQLGVVFVAAAGNANKEVKSWPQLAVHSLDGMLVVGATTVKGTLWGDSNYGKAVNAWAPGDELPKPPGDADHMYDAVSGTSYGKSRHPSRTFFKC